MSSSVSFFSVLNSYCRDLLSSCLDLQKDFLKLYYKYFLLVFCLFLLSFLLLFCFLLLCLGSFLASLLLTYRSATDFCILTFFFWSCYCAESVYSSRCFLIVFQVLGCRIELPASRNNSVSWFPVCVPIFLSLGPRLELSPKHYIRYSGDNEHSWPTWEEMLSVFSPLL